MDLQPVFVLRGHESDVLSLDYMSCNWLCSGDQCGNVKIWDLTECRCISSAQLHTTNAGVLSLQYLKASSCLVSSGRDGTVHVWQVLEDMSLSSAPLVTIHSDVYSFCRVAACEYPVQGRGATSSMLTPSVPAQPLPSEQAAPMQPGSGSGAPEPAEGHGQGDAVPSASCARLLACPGPEPGDVACWDMLSGAPAFGLGLGHSKARGMCMALAFLPQSQGADAPVSPAYGGCCPAAPAHVAVGYEDGSVAMWDVRKTDQPLCCARLHDEPVMALSLAQHGKQPSTAFCVSGSADNGVCFADFGLGNGVVAKIQKVGLPSAGVCDLAIRADRKIVAAGCWDGKVRVYSCKKRAQLAALKYHRGHATSVRFAPDCSLLASGSRDCSVAVWSIYASAGTATADV